MIATEPLCAGTSASRNGQHDEEQINVYCLETSPEQIRFYSCVSEGTFGEMDFSNRLWSQRMNTSSVAIDGARR
jgi:hypothetical protein